MLIKLRMICFDLPLENRTFELDAPPDATVETALQLFAELYEGELPFDVLKDPTFLLNGKSVRPDGVLSPGDQLTILRTMAGG